MISGLARESLGILLVQWAVYTLEVFLNRDLQNWLASRKIEIETDGFSMSPILYLLQRRCHANHTIVEGSLRLLARDGAKDVPEMRAIRETYVLLNRFTGSESVDFTSIHAQAQRIFAKSQLHLLRVYPPLSGIHIETAGPDKANQRQAVFARRIDSQTRWAAYCREHGNSCGRCFLYQFEAAPAA